MLSLPWRPRRPSGSRLRARPRELLSRKAGPTDVGSLVRQKHVDPFVAALEPARNKAACSAARPSLRVRRSGCFCVLPGRQTITLGSVSCRAHVLSPLHCLWQGAIYMRPSGSRGGVPKRGGKSPLRMCSTPCRFCLLLLSSASPGPLPSAAVGSSFPPAKCLRRPARLSSGGDALRSQGHTGRNERGDCRLGRGGRSGAGGPWSALPLPLSVACAVHDGTQTAGTFLRSRFAVARVPSARGPRRWRFSWCSQLFRWLILTDFSSCWCCRLRFGRMCWCLVRRARIPCFDRGGFSPALLRSIRARWPGLFASATFVRLPAVRPCPESLVLNTFCVPGG